MNAAPLWLSLSAQVVRRLPRGRYRAMNLLSQTRPPSFVANIPGEGLRFECDLRNALAREVFFTGQYEPQETCLVRALLAPGNTFVDVGAHWGYFSLLAAKRVSAGGRVVSVEADPRIYALLSRNVRLNQDAASFVPLPRIDAVQVAVADKPGTLTLTGFSETDENWGVSSLAGDALHGGTSGGGAHTDFQVEAKPLDALLDGLGVDAVDLVKMDIEGAEAMALAGMAAGLRRHRYRRLLMELHPVQLRALGSDVAQVAAALTGAGYRGFTIAHSAEATRRAAYASHLRARELLRPLDPGAPLDAWPHVLWVAPGVTSPQ